MNAKNLIGGFIAGAALGVAAGMLMAPYSGEKSRKKLVRGSAKIKRNVANYVEKSLDDIRTQMNDKIEKISRAGKDTLNGVAEKIKM